MPQDAILEFLNENRGRSYPLESHLDLSSEIATENLPKSILLDLRGFSRGEPIPNKRPRLLGVAGPEIDALETSEGRILHPLWSQGYFMFVFASGTYRPDSSQELLFKVYQSCPAKNPAQPLGVRQQDHLDSPFGGDGQCWGSLEVTFSEDAGSTLDPAMNFVPEDAPIESGLFALLWEAEISRLAVESASGQVTNLWGSLEFCGGHNMDVVAYENVITLFPERGAGTGPQPFEEAIDSGSEGMFGSLGIEEPEDLITECQRAIYQINGMTPAENGEFTIVGENGVVVKPDSLRYRIVIDVVVPQPNKVCISN